MKKILYLIAGLALSGAMASCSENNDEPNVSPVETTSGVFVVNNGNMGSNIPSSVTAYDYHTGLSTDALQDAFTAANGVALGEGAQGPLVYGTKMYVPMQDSNLVWVLEAATLKVLGTVRPEGQASGPRAVAAGAGKVFASMTSGYVCVIDTTTLKIDRTIQTGPNPEQMAVQGGKLYVANSDGYNWDGGYVNGSISIIDLSTWSQSYIKDISKVLNPTDMVTNGSDVFVICKGNYADVLPMVKKISGSDVVDVAEGNYMAIDGQNLYVINAPISGTRDDVTFDVYDTYTLQRVRGMISQVEGSESWIESPACIAVDPATGDIAIASYTLSEAGRIQYSIPGYTNIYDKNGVLKHRFACGVGPVGIAFVH